MAEFLTKSRARNIFYGGSIFFVVVFIGMTVHSHKYVVDVSTASMPLSEEVIHGKHIWEENSCINCHSLHGEGAYFAPEVGNVMTRWGVLEDPEGAFEMLKGWLMPSEQARRTFRNKSTVKILPPSLSPERVKVDDFYAARSGLIPPLPWSTFSPPFSYHIGDCKGHPYRFELSRHNALHHRRGLADRGADFLPGAQLLAGQRLDLSRTSDPPGICLHSACDPGCPGDHRRGAAMRKPKLEQVVSARLPVRAPRRYRLQ